MTGAAPAAGNAWALGCLLLLLLLPFRAAAGQAAPDLQAIDVRPIADRARGFSEPSGLALAADGQGYWSVSDDSPGIFRLSSDGRLDPARGLPLPVTGLEGVAEDPARNRLLVVREDTAEILALGLQDGRATRHPLPAMDGFAAIAAQFGTVGSNSGLEGITLDPLRNEVLVIKEAGPRLLIRVSPDLTTILGAVELSADKGFGCDGRSDAGLDVSDLTYDPGRDLYWILSDRGACVVLFDPATGQAEGLALPPHKDHPKHRPRNPEGIALSPDGRELRLVTDDGKDSRLWVFSIGAAERGPKDTP